MWSQPQGIKHMTTDGNTPNIINQHTNEEKDVKMLAGVYNAALGNREHIFCGFLNKYLSGEKLEVMQHVEG